MERDAVLYALSTLAQTCAALAAFVGAVGLYRLGQLAERRDKVELELRALIDRGGGPARMPEPMDEIIRRVERERQRANEPENLQNVEYQAYVKVAEDARERWMAFPHRSRQSRLMLILFEVWNLAVIAVSLIGFNHVQWLTASPTFTFWTLLTVAIITAAVTVGSVYAWTRG